jgi:hypothetical protein
MKDARKKLQHWRTISANFEKAYKRLEDKNAVLRIVGKLLGLEPEQYAANIVRQTLTRRIKYWKTVVRYPVAKHEVLLIGFDTPNANYDEFLATKIKFPVKVKIVDGDWDNIPYNTPRVIVNGRFTSITYFLTGSSYHNQNIKKFNKWLV